MSGLVSWFLHTHHSRLNARLASHEGVSRFQSGTLPEKDQEWHKLVPTEAREALGKQEVQRQSVIFELFKSERDYVSDLEAVKEVRESTYALPILLIYLGLHRWFATRESSYYRSASSSGFHP